MDPNVFLTVVFASWVVLFALALAVVVRHERLRDAAAERAAHGEAKRRVSEPDTLDR